MVRKVSIKESGREARRSALMDAAASLFAELGYEGTTIESIARRAGMAKGSFYLHFHSKEEIFRALMQKAGDWLVHRMRDIAGGEDSLRGKLERMAGIILAFHLHSGHPWFFILMEKGLERQKVLEHFYEKRKVIVEIINGVLTSAMGEGQIIRDDPERLSSLFLGCVNGAVVRGCCSDTVLDADAEAAWIAERFLHGCGSVEEGER